MAYHKYMSCWGPNSGVKSTTSKVSKQAALTLVKQTLNQYHEFETTGKTHSNDPQVIKLTPVNSTETLKKFHPPKQQFQMVQKERGVNCSWLNIDDDGLHDDDIIGLEILMNDL